MNGMNGWLVLGALAALTPLGAAAQQQFFTPGRWAATPADWWSAADARQDEAGQNQELNVTLQFHLIEADGFETTDPSIEGIVEELRGVFRFEGYRLFDSALVTAAVPAYANTRMGDPERSYEVSASLDETSDPARVRVSVSLSSDAAVFLPDGSAHNVGEILSASVNVADGQTVILGSGRPTGAEATLILAMTAMISD